MAPDAELYLKAQTLLAAHGSVQSQPAIDWRGDIPLPAEVAAFYELAGPLEVVVKGYGNPTRFPSLANLWDHQKGYRWHGNTGVRLPDWKDNWLVIASQGSDPYIFDIGTGQILFDIVGQGAWRPKKQFPNFPMMACCVATLGSIKKAAGRNFTDEESFVTLTCKNLAVDEIAGLTGSKSSAEIVVNRAGWVTSDQFKRQ
jgi:hypothetical protein